MNYYQDITLIPDTDINLGFLWYKVFLQIHIGLADNKQTDGTSAIAVSFPGYVYAEDKQHEFPLGNSLRLLAEAENQLRQFDSQKRLSRLQDYCHIKPVKPIPESSKHVRFRRKQLKSEAKKAAGLAKHLNKPIDEIVQYRKNNGLIRECRLPFIPMESQQPTETGQKHKFRLFIEREFFDAPVEGVFDCYGLSKIATVPWF